MYLVGDSFRVSFKWVVIISTKQETANTQSAKVSTCYTLWHFGDWSLIRGATKQLWGASEVLPLQKGGRLEKSFSRAERGGGTKCFAVVLTWELEVLAIVMGGGRKQFPPFKVRLRWLGADLPYPGKIYSFLLSSNNLIMIINH